MDWNTDMSAAPYRTPVVLELEDGTELLATLEPDAAMTDEEMSCDQWHEVNEGEAPECWSGGACWTSNEYEALSLQPVKWKLPAWQEAPPRLRASQIERPHVPMKPEGPPVDRHGFFETLKSLRGMEQLKGIWPWSRK